MADGHGGKRAGAGRRPGSRCRKTIEAEALARQAAGGPVTPLSVLLDVMRRHFDAGEYEEAVAVAVAAAPYCHARLSSMQADVDVTQYVTLELVEQIVTAPALPEGRPGGQSNGEARF